MTIAAIGCSQYRDYSFLVPLTALFWRDVIGFTPRVFLVGTEDEWLPIGNKPNNFYPHGTRTVISALQEHEIDHVFVPRFGEYSEPMIAQSIRQHAAADPAIPDDAWIMQSDADLWPLRTGFYYQHVAAADKLAACYYANGDGFEGKATTIAKYKARVEIQSIPTCHVVMRAKEWRAVYGMTVDGDVAGNTMRTLDRHRDEFQREFSGKDANLSLWCTDQWLLTYKLCCQPWFPERALLINRHGGPPVDRLDRSLPNDWDQGFDPSRWTDAHVFKGPELADNWPKLLRVIDTLLPEYSGWAREYREEYVK